MLKIGLALAAVGLLAACETDTSRFTGPGGSGVYPIGSDKFEVVAQSVKGAPVFWCGASDYARRVLGAGWNDEISIARTLGPSEATDRTSAVQFTLNPAALGITKVRSNFPNQLVVGDTNSVTQANLYCDKLRFRNF